MMKWSYPDSFKEDLLSTSEKIRQKVGNALSDNDKLKNVSSKVNAVTRVTGLQRKGLGRVNLDPKSAEARKLRDKEAKKNSKNYELEKAINDLTDSGKLKSDDAQTLLKKANLR